MQRIEHKKRALLLIQLGTPKSPSSKDVGIYLKEFLMDKYVIDLSFIIRWFLVHILIVPRRKWTSKKAYESIWKKEGSPLFIYSKKLSQALQVQLKDRMKVMLSMRYGSPSILESLKTLKGFDEILVQSLYPHYTLSSMETAHRETLKQASKLGIERTRIRFLPEFFDKSFYIDSLASKIKRFLEERQKNPPIEHLLFSYHGLPSRHIRKLDPLKHCQFDSCCTTFTHPRCYRAQCFRTSFLLAQKIGWDKKNISTSFQSRLGWNWIKPYTVQKLKDLKEEGIKRILVMTPSFISDCLENLEEVGIRLRQDFIQGEDNQEDNQRELFLLPSLNDDKEFVSSFANYLKNN